MTTFVLSPLAHVLMEQAAREPSMIKPIARVREITSTGRTIEIAKGRAIAAARQAYGKPAMQPWIRTIAPVGHWELWRVTVAWVVVL